MKGVRIWLMLAGISMALLLPAQNSYYELAGISVNGARLSDEAAIIAMSGLRVGQGLQIPGTKITNAIQSLGELHLFEKITIHKVRTEGELAFLEIEVKEAARLGRWQVRGLKRQALKNVEDLLKQHLQKGAGWLKADQYRIRQVLNHHFEQDGYAFAEVELQEHYLNDSSRVDLLFELKRGKKQKIGAIHFTGNRQVNDKKLRKQMSLKGNLIRKGLFVAEGFEQDKQKILQYYETLGYKDARIIKDSLWKDKKGRLQMAITVEEGSLYYIGGIQWIGNSIYPASLLQKLLAMEAGDVYNRPLLEERLFYSENTRDISSLYMDNGYLFVNIEAIEKGIDGNRVDLEIRITEGPPATISEVVIEGNDRTSENVIRRELETSPGQAFDRSAILRSQRALMALGYFNPESLGVSTKVDPEQSTVAITYELEESRSETFELSAGYNPSSNQVVGTLGISLNNFSFKNLLNGENWNPLPSGDGQALSLRLQSTGAEYQGANFTFSEPWLGGKRPNLFTLSGFYQRFTNGEDSNSDAFSSLSVGGGSLQLGTRFRALGRVFAFTTELSAQHIYLNGYRDIQLDDGSSLSTGRFNNIYLKPRLAYRTIGDPFFPREGVMAELSAQFTPPYAALGLGVEGEPHRWLEYHKWRFDIESYLPLSSNLVLKGSWKMGWLGSYNAALGTSPFERFELGGNGISSQQGAFVGNDILSMRGYEQSDFTANEKGGGAAFAKATVELRYEVANTPSLRAYVLGFAEAGNLWQQSSHLNPFDLRPALGAGLRLQLPMFGTVGVDYGLGLNKPGLSGEHWSKYGTFNLILGIEPE